MIAQRVTREANRRGFEQANRRVVMGDSALWIWNLVEEYWPDAIQIVDLYHAKGHPNIAGYITHDLIDLEVNQSLHQVLIDLQAETLLSYLSPNSP